MLWRIWHVLTVIAAAHGNPRHRFDPATLRSLKPRTIRSYQIQVNRFVQWLDHEGRKPEDEYDHSQDEDAAPEPVWRLLADSPLGSATW